MTAVPSRPASTRLALSDGRSLDLWVDEDAATGLQPLLFHAGTPASGLPFDAFTAAARQRGLRMISWSRPGYGSSTRPRGRQVVQVVDDAAAVLDHLGVEQAYHLGHSGGGPHALACAAMLPDRVLGTALIASVAPSDAAGLDFLAGMGPENHEEFAAAVAGEAALRPFIDAARETILGLTGADVAAMFGELIDEVDRDALTGDYAAFVAAQMREGQRESSDGWVDDDLAFVQPWGFDLEAIPGRVHVWQGAHDLMVPFAHGRWLVGHLGNPCAHLLPEHGHMSLAVAGLPAVLDTLLAGA